MCEPIHLAGLEINNAIACKFHLVTTGLSNEGDIKKAMTNAGFVMAKVIHRLLDSLD